MIISIMVAVTTAAAGAAVRTAALRVVRDFVATMRYAAAVIGNTVAVVIRLTGVVARVAGVVVAWTTIVTGAAIDGLTVIRDVIIIAGVIVIVNHFTG